MSGERDVNDALFLLEHPLIVRTLEELEQNAVNHAIAAPYNDHEKRQAFLADARSIRALRSKLKALSESTAKPARKGSVA
ncbi:hypothetical protein [Phyllobacterium sp. OV277]|uniref:hypothetical protein n=1 Tax=Phyllobacterium sp. OV277 TaxID=1882772 RepID=UPI000887D33D|nr:hypothetical protein [Phyllobacterium sp. OV277]SDP08697.1 hypothetical protein SAMN05443582_103365 [Phyllobacterium sp. OV277]